MHDMIYKNIVYFIFHIFLLCTINIGRPTAELGKEGWKLKQSWFYPEFYFVLVCVAFIVVFI